MGPMNPKSKGGALYVLTFIDDYSRFVYVYLLAAKSQVFERFKAFRAMVETQTDCKIKCIRIDNGGEYTNHRFNKHCADLGIIHQTSVPYNPQQNSLAERMNRIVLLYSCRDGPLNDVSHGSSSFWWGGAIMAAVYTINRIRILRVLTLVDLKRCMGRSQT